MLQTLDESGHIHFFEPVKISGLQRILVTLLDTPDKPVMTTSAAQGMMPVRGAMKGMLSRVDEFIANKASEITLEDQR
jgi:hypothetical protein